MITVEHVSKQYRVYRRHSDRLRELLLRRKLHDVKLAIQEVDFKLEDGRVLGVIGRNGAGKSTLLKLVMGVILPDQGSITLSGRVTGLLELGTGFNSDLSGYDNIAFNAALLGMTPMEVEKQRQAIIDFSELGAAIHHPVRTYSSGMTMRLAFSIAIHANPSCLVVDEALAVGDAHFQQKCVQRIKDFRDSGGAILFVSNDMNAVKVLCDSTIVLEEGRTVFSGTPDDAVNYYNRLIADMDKQEMSLESPVRSLSDPLNEDVSRAGYGTGVIKFQGSSFRGLASGGAIVSSGEISEFVFDLRAQEALASVTLGIMIRDRLGQDIYGTNTFFLERPLSFEAGEQRTIVIRMAINLAPGHYTLTAALHDGDNHLTHCYHWCDNLIEFEVAGYIGPRFGGICRLEPSVHMVAAGRHD